MPGGTTTASVLPQRITFESGRPSDSSGTTMILGFDGCSAAIDFVVFGRGMVYVRVEGPSQEFRQSNTAKTRGLYPWAGGSAPGPTGRFVAECGLKR